MYRHGPDRQDPDRGRALIGESIATLRNIRAALRKPDSNVSREDLIHASSQVQAMSTRVAEHLGPTRAGFYNRVGGLPDRHGAQLATRTNRRQGSYSTVASRPTALGDISSEAFDVLRSTRMPERPVHEQSAMLQQGNSRRLPCPPVVAGVGRAVPAPAPASRAHAHTASGFDAFMSGIYSNDSIDPGKIQAHTQATASLKPRRSAADMEDVCSICLDGVVMHDLIIELPCCHTFHHKCLDSWLRKRTLCPLCKASAV
jgi:hypothetical protein